MRDLIQEPQVILQEYISWQLMQRGQQGQFQGQLGRLETQMRNVERRLHLLVDAY